MAGRILTSALYVFGLVLFYIGAGRLVRYFGRKNPKVLLYHDCAPAETTYTAGLDCTTSPEAFSRHLEYIGKRYRVVDIQDIAAGRAGLSAVAITFDDGYRSVYQHAVPRLAAQKLPATVFLISDVIGNQCLVWVNELNHALRTAPATTVALVAECFPGAPLSGPGKIIDHCRINYDPQKISELMAALRSSTEIPVRQHAEEALLYLDWDEIEQMQHMGVSL